MIEPLRFAYPYYSRRAGRLAFSTVATALQSLLFIPALILIRRAFDTARQRGRIPASLDTLTASRSATWPGGRPALEGRVHLS